MIKLNTPISQTDILKLKVGDRVALNGTIFTARDRAHQVLLTKHFDKLQRAIIYHCGPLIKDKEVVSAGPTTSDRLNIYTPELVDKYDISAIIGKGGMNDEVIDALKGRAVYFAAIGGAGVLYAQAMRFKNMYKQELGMAEAIWEFEIKDFPVIVAIDAYGQSLYKNINQHSQNIIKDL